MDLLFGDDGLDRVSYADAAAGVVVQLNNQVAWDGASMDYMASIENATGSNFADSITGSDGANDLAGGAGDDVIAGGGGNDTIDGGTGNDIVYGEAGDDVLRGGAGDDVLIGGAGVDLLFGDEGLDRVSYADAAAGVVIQLNNQVAWDGVSMDYMASIENATGSNFADSITGSDGANDLAGGAGDDVIEGGAGDDVLYGGAGDDVLVGGGGSDIANYGGALSEYVIESLGNGAWRVTDTVLDRDGVDTLFGIEQLSFGDGLTIALLHNTVMAASSTKSDGAAPLVLPSIVDEGGAEPQVLPADEGGKSALNSSEEPEILPGLIDDGAFLFHDQPQVLPGLDVNDDVGAREFLGHLEVALDSGFHQPAGGASAVFLGSGVAFPTSEPSPGKFEPLDDWFL